MRFDKTRQLELIERHSALGAGSSLSPCLAVTATRKYVGFDSKFEARLKSPDPRKQKLKRLCNEMHLFLMSGKHVRLDLARK
jgi:hypothetical protein